MQIKEKGDFETVYSKYRIKEIIEIKKKEYDIAESHDKTVPNHFHNDGKNFGVVFI